MGLNTSYQYESPKMPSSWGSDDEKRRFYNRLIDVLDDIYLKYGRIDEKMLSVTVRKTLEEAGGIITEVVNARGDSSTLTQRFNEIESEVSSASIYDGEEPPETADVGKLWLDRGVDPSQLRRWRGLTTTPSGADMTLAREIDETVSGRVVSIDNSDDQIDGPLSVTVQGLNLLPLNKSTFSVTSKGVTMTYNGDGSFTFTGTATGDESFIISNKDAILYYRLYYHQTQLVASTRCTNYPSTGGVTFSVRDNDDWNVLADFPATDGQYQAFTGDGKEALIFFYVTSGTTFAEAYTVRPQIQTGSTPTAFTPYKGSVKITRCGKNLFDVYAFCESVGSVQSGTMGKYPESGGFDLTATADDCYTWPWDGTTYEIPVKPSTTYTLHWDIYISPENGSQVMWFIDHRFETGYYGVQNYDAHSATFTTPADAKSVSFRFGVNKSGESVGYANLQLEEGSAFTAFELYSGVTTEVPLDRDAYHGWMVEMDAQVGLNNILTDADAMSVDYACTGWETVNDPDVLDDLFQSRITQTKDSLSAEITNLRTDISLYLRSYKDADNNIEGVELGRTDTNTVSRIVPGAFQVWAPDDSGQMVKTASLGNRESQIGRLRIYQTADGGTAFNVM